MKFQNGYLKYISVKRLIKTLMNYGIFYTKYSFVASGDGTLMLNNNHKKLIK